MSYSPNRRDSAKPKPLEIRFQRVCQWDFGPGRLCIRLAQRRNLFRRLRAGRSGSPRRRQSRGYTGSLDSDESRFRRGSDRRFRESAAVGANIPKRRPLFAEGGAAAIPPPGQTPVSADRRGRMDPGGSGGCTGNSISPPGLDLARNVAGRVPALCPPGFTVSSPALLLPGRRGLSVLFDRAFYAAGLDEFRVSPVPGQRRSGRGHVDHGSVQHRGRAPHQSEIRLRLVRRAKHGCISRNFGCCAPAQG